VLVPSRVEPLGNTAVEAFAQRPLVALRVPGLTGIVEDGRTRPLVPPVDPAALADAIARFLQDSGTRRRAERPTRPSRRAPRVTSMLRPCRHPPLPAAAALRSTSIPPGELGTVITGDGRVAGAGLVRGFRRRPGGLLVLAPGGAAALQRALDRNADGR
jgi:hypothetical protein